MTKSIVKTCLYSIFLITSWTVLSAGCTGGSESITTNDWLTFYGSAISLELPDGFCGGDPRDPAAFEELMNAAECTTERSVADGLLSWLSEVQTNIDVGLPGCPELLIFGRPGIEGDVPVVEVWKGIPIEDGTPEDYLRGLIPSAYSDTAIENAGENLAYCAFPRKWWWSDKTSLTIVAASIVDSGPYLVYYTLDDSSNSKLEPIFKTSVLTIGAFGEESHMSDWNHG